MDILKSNEFYHQTQLWQFHKKLADGIKCTAQDWKNTGKGEMYFVVYGGLTAPCGKSKQLSESSAKAVYLEKNWKSAKKLQIS